MLNSAPAAWTPSEIIRITKSGQGVVETPAGYEPARKYGFYSLGSRFRHAWAVFTGKADALYWPWQEPPKAF